MIKYLTATIIFALAANICFAQQNKIPFEGYGVTDGLPEIVVSDIVQDDQGLIWFTTQNGLVKYDGYQFRVYKSESNSEYSLGLPLKFGRVQMVKSRDGKIWIAPNNRIISFDPVTEAFRTYDLSAENSENPNIATNLPSYISLVGDDEKGNIWFYFKPRSRPERYLCRLDPETGFVKEYSQKIYGFWGEPSGIIAEASGHMWMVNHEGKLYQLNENVDSFEPVIHATEAKHPIGDGTSVTILTTGGDSSLLLTNEKGLFIFDTDKNEITKSYLYTDFSPNGSPESRPFYSIQNPSGEIWIIHHGGAITMVDPLTGNINTLHYGQEPFKYDQGPNEIAHVAILGMDERGTWAQSVGPESFIFYYDHDTRSLQFYDDQFNSKFNALPKGFLFSSFIQDGTGLIWIGTNGGLFKQAPRKRQMELFLSDPTDENSLPSDDIQYLFEDRQSRLWIGTGNGLALYMPARGDFQVFQHEPFNGNSLSNNQITSIVEDAQGNIWIGTQNGLNLWRENSAVFKRFYYNPSTVNFCQFLFLDNQNRLWVALGGETLLAIEGDTGKETKKIPLSGKVPKVIYQDSRNNLWIGTGKDGLYRMDETEEQLIAYLPIEGDSSSISSPQIRFIAEDGKNRLWIGTNQGNMNEYIFEKDNFVRYMDPWAGSMQIFGKDKTGKAWFATSAGSGLATIDESTRKYEFYGENSGMLHNDISGLRMSNQNIPMDVFGHLWLPTQRGLSEFDPTSKTFVSYFEKDGFQPYSNNYFSIRTRNGDIWIGGKNGLNRIVPKNLMVKDSTTAQVVITNMSINDSLYSQPDNRIFKNAISHTDQIELKHWQRDLTFEYVYPHYLRSEDNLYSWRLKNYNDTWTAPSKERKATLTNLSPGRYEFQVIAANADGIWNNKPTTMYIVILAPWWQTWWAVVAYILTIALAFRGYIRYKSKKLIEQNTILEEKVAHRTKELKQSLNDLKATQAQLIQSEKMASLGELTAGIAHEIQNPLNFVNNFSEVSAELVEEIEEERAKSRETRDETLVSEILGDIKQNLEKINHHGKRAGAIVKGMLEHSRKSEGEKAPTDLNALADEYLRLSYHGLRAKDKSFNADFTTDFDPNLPHVNVVASDIGRVLLNLINNAFYAVDEKAKSTSQEGYKPEVIVKSTTTKSPSGDLGVAISVSDNGPGIPDSIKEKIFQPFFTTKPTGSGTGLGLSLSYDIVKAHGGDFRVQSTLGEGTEITLFLSLD
jgi:signal transduction histidine kinase/ligand-binding sensor domain-containing protein